MLKTRRFLPLFATQFLGAFNDNVFKNAVVILITYAFAERAGLNPQILVTLAAGIFILPFFLFSATAGQLADKCDKARLIRVIKAAEIVIMGGAALGFALESVPLLMTVLFLMGAQSAFFGPLKYGILPDQLEEDELIGGNALVETGTFLSILAGTILGGLLVLTEGGLFVVSALVLGVSALGWTASLFVPGTRAAQPALRIDYNFVAETWRIIRHAASRRDIFLSILGIAWFWLVGATFLSQFPNLAKDVVGGNEELVTLFLTTFSVGIAGGSLLCNRLLKGEISATFVPLGALGISLFSLDLFFASRAAGPAGADPALIGAAAFLSTWAGWRMVIDLLLVAVSGGLYIVPLYAILQSRSEAGHRARNIASNNVMGALFMVVSALGTTAMLALGFSVSAVILTVAVLNTAVGVYICGLLPGALVRAILRWLLDLFFRIEVRGLENYRKAGEKTLIVANHLSFLDAVLISAFVPERLTFAVNTHIAKRRLIKPFLALADTYAIDPTNPMATRALIEAVREKRKLVIFPEGRITVTGSLMKVYEGPGLVADKSGAQILPVRIDGAQYTPFSRLKGKVRMRLFPKITLTFLERRRFEISEELKGRRRRQFAASKLYDLMTEMIFQSSDHQRTLFQSLIEARRVHGGGHLVLEDIERQPLSYRKLVLASFALGRGIARATRPAEHVGVLLPNMAATAVTFFALHAFGRVPAMLNFSTGSRNVLLACRAGAIRSVYTSRRFVETAGLGELVGGLEGEDVRVVYLEDLRRRLSLLDRALAFAAALAPQLACRLAYGERDPHASGVVLFTSGTEGAPKGVVLSHANLQANRYQVSSRIDFGPTDVVFNALPMFHSFGLTCGTLLPVLSGIRTFLYPSPLHYRIVPQLVYDTNASILFGTDTFLSGYARFAHPYDFYSVRYVFAGAEKLRDETRRLWSERYGVRIFEGYGATETAPALAMNTPMENRPGSVGRLMPGIAHRLEPVGGIHEGGKLLVSGPNIMRGYLFAETPGVLSPPEGGWYDTGDIVALDDDGYVFIKGRAKRFAKIGGEMVSLAAVEGFLSQLWPEHVHAVVNLPDAKKGEQLVLVTDHPGANREEIIAHARQAGFSELSVPKSIVAVDKVPLLGTGKMDYVRIKELAAARLDRAA
ncbi:MAG: acyl-[ACP]--phospholipid O-acyltransferase [Gammaproteobacteria bacterium]|nr:acyl-[ACP]--phospholipid O-acyltransferase [Gammaproteobacteria bacterium]NIR84426.1 acyl-[ACP]--phospholipid O-acyltransferase [Gammaproteobacteria bacterium]NIR90907.1 acyl-[ACP]--phospholipid O-acyltransferase [Gammaproteobacteria bacterium]NIU07093.1 acyl-[ACP]--phospholipid O-acyltransferase [Gammaproteobacteria bacterium]NIV76222.1 acyl-[ACP]--phospholipid O-acyltransferase [Gammaproteobacteria bacterium]